MFNRFAICAAWYAFAANWHQGQWSPEYAIFGRLDRMGFKPGECVAHYQPSQWPKEGYQDERDAYARLVRAARKGWRPRSV